MSTFPNPDTYLNHFPPGVAAQFETARNLSLAVLGAMLWDILIYIPDDIKILRRSPLHLVTVCFVSSRLFSLAFVLLAVIEFTRPLANCTVRGYCIGAVCLLTVSSTTFIFLQRVRALYTNNRRIQAIAIILWLATCAAMSFTVFAAKSAHAPGTKYCSYTVIDRALVVAGFVFFAFDTFVFVAVSYQISASHSDVDVGISWKTAISGEALPRISRAILRGGQQYYLITICLQVPVVILTSIPSVPPNFKLMLTFPLGCISASMASRIFRNMQKRDIKRSEVSQPTGLSEVGFVTTSYQRKEFTISPEAMRTGTLHERGTLAIALPQTNETSAA